MAFSLLVPNLLNTCRKQHNSTFYWRFSNRLYSNESGIDIYINEYRCQSYYCAARLNRSFDAIDGFKVQNFKNYESKYFISKQFWHSALPFFKWLYFRARALPGFSHINMQLTAPRDAALFNSLQNKDAGLGNPPRYRPIIRVNYSLAPVIVRNILICMAPAYSSIGGGTWIKE